MRDLTSEESVSSNEPKPIRVKITTAVAFSAAAFVTGGLVCAATYGRVLKFDKDHCAAGWETMSEAFHDAERFLEKKNLLTEFVADTGHQFLLED